ncbi:hypothetical protein [Candidatus Protochlamydia amoebophila]|uniref:hypothetical protein n=1 Tax=Candidatus Protochlamydia amoebophila TaxID=362787 RepID=UPI001BC99954|nr:hypothetical protein [Candidatus Protochlamydia amoebophila]
MAWRSLDFYSLNNLDQKIVDQLELYLHQRETRLAYQILNAIPSTNLETFSPTLSQEGGILRLSDAVEGITKKVRMFVKTDTQRIYQDQDRNFRQHINHALWEFTEVLEGCVVELFQQIKQVRVDRWHHSIFKAVYAIKNILIHYIEDLAWAVRRLEKPLKEYFQYSNAKLTLFNHWMLGWQSFVDPQIAKNLNQSEIFLKKEYQAFETCYQNYMQISIKIEFDLEKMKTFQAFAQLGIAEQNLYVDVFRLLKTLEQNSKPKDLLSQETIRSLKNIANFDTIEDVLKKYHNILKKAFFGSSLAWKKLDKDEDSIKKKSEELKNSVYHYQYELQQLLETTGHYRTFLLKTDPDPYVGSRWGFSEWIVSPEPIRAKKLMHLMYFLDELNKGYEKFFKAFERDKLTLQQLENKAHEVIENLLHKMEQPLISRTMMQNRALQLIGQLQLCDEIGSDHFEIISYFDGILAKAMREDWKYHVLHGFPAFHEIYRQHKGLGEFIHDPSHAFRVERFQLLLDRVEGWIKKGEFYVHLYELELDNNDIKAYLQDFLAIVQRTEKEKSLDPFLDETIDRLKQQLLEYRYLFGQFLFNIQIKDIDGQYRNKFLFIEEYFETIENLLFELKISWEGKR